MRKIASHSSVKILGPLLFVLAGCAAQLCAASCDQERGAEIDDETLSKLPPLPPGVPTAMWQLYPQLVGNGGMVVQRGSPEASPASQSASQVLTPEQAREAEKAKIAARAAAEVPSKEALAALEQKASAGDVAAQSKLGQVYAIGLGVHRDFQEAAKWFRKAAEQGDTAAQLKLGVMYMGGFGVPSDPKEGIGWYQKAAAQGSTDAMWQLGNLYEHGIGVPTDHQQAVKWFLKAAAQGSGEARFSLCRMGHDEAYCEVRLSGERMHVDTPPQPPLCTSEFSKGKALNHYCLGSTDEVVPQGSRR